MENQNSDHPAREMTVPPEWKPGSMLKDIYQSRRGPHKESGYETVHIEHVEGGSTRHIYSYTTDASRYSSDFHPFRQWHNGSWHHYGFITPDRNGFSVINLRTGVVTPMMMSVTNPKTGGVILVKMPNKGKLLQYFIVRDFWTYDYRESYDDNDLSLAAIVYEENGEYTVRQKDLEELQAFNNQFALISVAFPESVDPHESVVYVNLERLTEGIVTVEDRFKNAEVSLPLDQAVCYQPDLSGQLIIQSPHYYTLSGELKWCNDTFSNQGKPPKIQED